MVRVLPDDRDAGTGGHARRMARFEPQSVAVVRVTHKPDRGWTPKACKERDHSNPGASCHVTEGRAEET